MVDRLELERRLSIAALVMTCLSAVIWLIAISTNEWCKVEFDEWKYINSSGANVKAFNMGLWTLCARLYFDATNTTDAKGPSRCTMEYCLSPVFYQ